MAVGAIIPPGTQTDNPRARRRNVWGIAKAPGPPYKLQDSDSAHEKPDFSPANEPWLFGCMSGNEFSARELVTATIASTGPAGPGTMPSVAPTAAVHTIVEFDFQYLNSDAARRVVNILLDCLYSGIPGDTKARAFGRALENFAVAAYGFLMKIQVVIESTYFSKQIMR